MPPSPLPASPVSKSGASKQLVAKSSAVLGKVLDPGGGGKGSSSFSALAMQMNRHGMSVMSKQNGREARMQATANMLNMAIGGGKGGTNTASFDFKNKSFEINANGTKFSFQNTKDGFKAFASDSKTGKSSAFSLAGSQVTRHDITPQSNKKSVYKDKRLGELRGQGQGMQSMNRSPGDAARDMFNSMPHLGKGDFDFKYASFSGEQSHTDEHGTHTKRQAQYSKMAFEHSSYGNTGRSSDQSAKYRHVNESFSAFESTVSDEFESRKAMRGAFHKTSFKGRDVDSMFSSMSGMFQASSRKRRRDEL